MSSIKQVRGQIRQIVQEILPDLIREEIYKLLEAKINERLSQINSNVNKEVAALAKQVGQTMTEIDERSKSVQHYVMRQGVKAQPSNPGDAKNE